MAGYLCHQHKNGISHCALFGQIARLPGSDTIVYSNFGGRFSTFGRAECEAIAQATADPFGHLKPILPVPAGGITIARIPETLEVYGREVILLVGGGLHQGERGLVEVEIINDEAPPFYQWVGFDGTLDVLDIIFLGPSWPYRSRTDLTGGDLEVDDETQRPVANVLVLSSLDFARL